VFCQLSSRGRRRRNGILSLNSVRSIDARRERRRSVES
jgi:hypothetical protein